MSHQDVKQHATNPWKQMLAFVRRDSRIAVTYRLQFLFQFCQVFVGTAVIYFIGKMLVASGRPTLMKGYQVDYFSFALVGVAIASYSRAGLISVTEEIRQVMVQGTLEAIFASPIGYVRVLFYSSIWHFLFETIRVGCYLFLGMAVFGMSVRGANWVGVGVILLLTLSVFLMVGVMSCSLLILVKKGDPINWFFSSISTLLAGAMFPITVFPEWLQTLSLGLPLTHSLTGLRKCMLLGLPIRDVSGNICALAVFVVVFFVLMVVTTRVCIKKAKRDGALSSH